MAHLDAHQTVALGIFRSPKSTPIYNKRPLRHEYYLTEKGEAFPCFWRCMPGVRPGASRPGKAAPSCAALSVAAGSGFSSRGDAADYSRALPRSQMD